ncbi:unnamed protein product [Acanthoscelides obtectus]|uniref:Uncharacterized protein n=1 Tax=Acanthoscelides obtectus TaxID=200917 RepID=A0A9P0VUP0_ACAOB|nr:unnamed protein product [Acanthoscelides obtectus]CAK1682459.1 hypothetical protein AOBTE_LOCUS33644 [Acanthoscelides obtectus]
MKEALKQRLTSRVKSILKTHLSAIHKVRAINTYAIPTITYSFGIIKWTDSYLEQLNRNIRVLFTNHRARHPKSSIERFYLPDPKGDEALLRMLILQKLELNAKEKNQREFVKQEKEKSRINKSAVGLSCNKEKCKIRCSVLFSEDHRREIHNQFWELSHAERRSFVLSSCERLEIKRRTTENNAEPHVRHNVFKYTFKDSLGISNTYLILHMSSIENCEAYKSTKEEDGETATKYNLKDYLLILHTWR